jgi:osmotically-inducible protein OsmY
VNVNVVDGVVYLRGELEDADRIRELVAAAESIEGVTRVESMLHTPV